MTGPDAAGAVVVLGGYGAVGRAASEALARAHPGGVVVAGRDGARAQRVAEGLPGRAWALAVDLARREDVARALDGALVVVMAVERDNAAVARACLERGIHYVDVSATTAVLDAVGALDGLAARRGATAALSVGLAPGVTNLLARLCHRDLPGATRLDLALCFGLGGDHGAGSRRWVLDGLAAPAGRAVRPVRVQLPGFGRRTVHPFPFSDQDTLAAALRIPVATRLCFDSAAVTAASFVLRRARVLPLLARLGAMDRLEPLLTRLSGGDDRFVIRATATDGRGGEASRAVHGRQECRATGAVAAHVAGILAAGSAPVGVRHIDDLVDPEEFLRRLDREGVVLAAGGTAGVR